MMVMFELITCILVLSVACLASAYPLTRFRNFALRSVVRIVIILSTQFVHLRQESLVVSLQEELRPQAECELFVE